MFQQILFSHELIYVSMEYKHKIIWVKITKAGYFGSLVHARNAIEDIKTVMHFSVIAL